MFSKKKLGSQRRQIGVKNDDTIFTVSSTHYGSPYIGFLNKKSWVSKGVRYVG